MRLPSWCSCFWWMAPLLALAFLLWTNARRVQRVEHLTSIPQWSVDPAKLDPHSPTGYADGRRELVIPEHNNDSYQWIAQTQQMLASGEWRLRHVDYDNAPQGREVNLPSLYRWWLAFVAWCDQALSGRSLGLAVEHGALWADPVLQLLLLVSATAFTARFVGRFAAALVALGCVALFPFGGNFLAGAPDRAALSLLCAVWSVLPLVVGIRSAHDVSSTPSAALAPDAPRRARRCFVLAAGAGGLGLWLNVDTQWPILLGLATAALLSAGFSRQPIASPLPWRLWGLCGCAVSLLGYFAEYFPDHVTWRMGANHPLFALSWWGAGELIAHLARWRQRRRLWEMRRELAGWIIATFLFITAPVAALWTGSRGWLADEVSATRLTTLDGGIVAPNWTGWIMRDGLTTAVWSTCLPVLLLIAIAAWQIARKSTTPAHRTAIGISLGALLGVLPGALLQLRSWNTLDALLIASLPALVPVAAYANRRACWLWSACAAGLVGLALAPLWPDPEPSAQMTATETEAQGLMERDLAQWLALRVDRSTAVVLAPPDLTTSLFFHGGVRGLGTLYPENRAGVAAAVRIVSATSRDETLELCRGRGLTHILVPSWDSLLNDYVRMGTSMPEQSFMEVLHRWKLPNWIRPVPYYIPKFSGTEAHGVAVFQLTDEQSEPVAASRIAEFFIEMGQTKAAEAMAATLRRYPSHPAALVALAEIAIADGNNEALDGVLATLLPYVASGTVRSQPWDRRVSLAIVLAQAKRGDLALEEAKKCLAQIDESRVRSLTTGSLFRFQMLCRKAGFEITDPRLRELARSLLPPDLRKSL